METTENNFHDTIWRAANEYGKVERGMSEARDLCYAILDLVPDDPEHESELLRYLANRWLDANGRNSFKESQRQASAR